MHLYLLLTELHAQDMSKVAGVVNRNSKGLGFLLDTTIVLGLGGEVLHFGLVHRGQKLSCGAES